VRPDLHRRILVRLDAIDKAASLAALSQPGVDFHPLRGLCQGATRSTSTARGASPSSGVRGGRCGSISNNIIDDEENMPAETLPATTPKHREYRVRRPLQRAPLHPGELMREILEEHVKMTITEAARRMKI
jgi:hypothetical protein